jgi:hypothetical protein
VAKELERLREMRDDYEAALDGAARLREEYHREIIKLHRAGVSLRDIADALGISHQRVHQIVTPPDEREKRSTRKTSRSADASAIAVLLLAGASVLYMRDRAHKPPVASPTVPSAAPSREDKADACKRFEALFRNQPAVTRQVDCAEVLFMSRGDRTLLFDPESMNILAVQTRAGRPA